MSRIQRPFLLVLLLGFVLGLAQAPAAPAQTPTLTPTSLRICGITARGLGYTEGEAVDNAKTYLYAHYFVSSYSVVASDCDYGSRADEMGLPTCYAELSACGVPRPRFP